MVPHDSNPVAEYLANDHDRLDALLRDAEGDGGEVELASFAEFRKGLLRHIGIEEKVLIPAITRLLGAAPVVAAQLRLDHGALASLLVLPPTGSTIRTIRGIIQPHNLLEEEPDGLYHLIRELDSAAMEELLRRVTSYPEVPVMPYNPGAFAMGAAERAVARAGRVLVA